MVPKIGTKMGTRGPNFLALAGSFSHPRGSIFLTPTGSFFPPPPRPRFPTPPGSLFLAAEGSLANPRTILFQSLCETMFLIFSLLRGLVFTYFCAPASRHKRRSFLVPKDKCWFTIELFNPGVGPQKL